MKTPIQELIEQLKELKDFVSKEHSLERSLPYQTAIDYAEKMLEKEREVMCYFADWCVEDADVEVDYFAIDKLFDKAFNTKDQ